jgi:hypothetical protein
MLYFVKTRYRFGPGPVYERAAAALASARQLAAARK